jgi:hypothetical protein
MKISLEVELIPAIGVVAGYQQGTGIILMIPFVSLTIKKLKKKKFHVNELKVGPKKTKPSRAATEIINKF